MKAKLLLNRKAVAASFLFAALSCSFSGFAQTPKVRSYATRQGNSQTGLDILGSFSNLSNCADADPATSGNMTMGIGVTASKTIYLDFNPSASSTATYATTIAANTPITIKFSLPAGLLNALGSVEIAAIKNLSKPATTWTCTDVGTAYSGSSLAGLLSGDGTMEYTITPTAAFQGIRIKISGVVGVAVGVDVYDAYVMTNTSSIVCSGGIDVLAGTRAGAVALANATGAVTDAVNVLDNSLNTYSTVSTGAQLLSQVYQTTIFNSPSKIGDSVQLVIQDASSNLLNLSLLQGLKVNLYLGATATPVQTITNDSTNLLTLNLLNPVGNIQTLTFVPNAVFDRVELQLGGVAGAFQTLRVYEVHRKNAGVALTASQKNIYAYAGQNFILNGTSIAPGDLVNYYDSLTGGNTLATNIVATTLGQANGTNSYYTGTTRNGCSEGSERKQIIGHIAGFTHNVPGTAQIGVPYVGSTSIILNAGAGLPLTPVYKYTPNTPLPPGLAIDTTTGVISGTPTTSGTYPLDMDVEDEANALPVGTFGYDMVVNSVPLATNLISFDGRADGNIVNLNWKIAATSDTKSFDIEKSIDGKSFQKMGSMSTIANQNTYSFADKNASNGLNYYRLKLTQKNDAFIYSNVINIELRSDAGIMVYPNPVESNKLFVKGENVMSLTVTNPVGQVITLPIVRTDNLQEIQTTSLSKGVYFLNIKKQNGETTGYRFIVK